MEASHKRIKTNTLIPTNIGNLKENKESLQLSKTKETKLN